MNTIVLGEKKVRYMGYYSIWYTVGQYVTIILERWTRGKNEPARWMPPYTLYDKTRSPLSFALTSKGL